MVEKSQDGGTRHTRRCPYCYELIHEDAVKCRYCKTVFHSPGNGRDGQRNEPGKMLFGVCTALAARFSIPVTFVRLIFVLLSFFHGFGVFLYLVLWALLPEVACGESRAGEGVSALRRFLRSVKRSFHEEFPAFRNKSRPGRETGDP
jgi:phage shock protein PspC (stress-responsive transcriptional regulator)